MKPSVLRLITAAGEGHAEPLPDEPPGGSAAYGGGGPDGPDFDDADDSTYNKADALVCIHFAVRSSSKRATTADLMDRARAFRDFLFEEV